MVRSKIEIKKIDNPTVRQVTFSKRRKGLIKKAQELSTLCDADIGLIVFSSNAKLYEFSNSRMNHVIQRYMRDTGNLDQLDSSLQPQPEDCDALRREVATRCLEMRRIQGEELEGLSIEELTKLERQLDRGRSRVGQLKDEERHKVIKGLKQKEDKLMQDNKRLKMTDIAEEHNSKHQLSKPSEHIHVHIQNNNVTFDTSLRLGLV